MVTMMDNSESEVYDKLTNPDLLEKCKLVPSKSDGNQYTLKLIPDGGKVSLEFPIVWITYKLRIKGTNVNFICKVWSHTVIDVPMQYDEDIEHFWHELQQFAHTEKDRIYNEKINKVLKLLKSLDL